MIEKKTTRPAKRKAKVDEILRGLDVNPATFGREVMTLATV